MLVASGCSFTERDWKSHFHKDLPHWTKWPERLGKVLGLDTVNLGKGGGSNDYAIRSIINEIRHNDEITCACLLLTEWNRFEVFGESLNHHVERNKQVKNLCKTIFEWTTPSLVFDKTTTEILNLIELCKYKKIKLVIGQSHIGPVWFDVMDRYEDGWSNREQVMKLFLRSRDFKLLDKQEDIIGWPFFPQLGGRWCSDPKNKISELDSHPNSEGQEYIMRNFLGRF